jgi:hypothetical protein
MQRQLAFPEMIITKWSAGEPCFHRISPFSKLHTHTKTIEPEGENRRTKKKEVPARFQSIMQQSNSILTPTKE